MLEGYSSLFRAHADRLAVDDVSGTWSYGEVLAKSALVARALLGTRSSLKGERVAFMAAPGRPWIAGLLGIWRAGGFAVPLALSHPRGELVYTLEDSGATWALSTADLASRVEDAAPRLPLVLLDDVLEQEQIDGSPELPRILESDPALLIYTSGTTGKPKGVVLSHGNLKAQVESLQHAWAWTPDDRILEILPLHHVHGIVNVVLCCLSSAASCRMMPRFDAVGTWKALDEECPTLFMAVPTIYVRLIAAWEAADRVTQQRWSTAAKRLRLMISGSAALPVPVLERWREITGHTLLERYGMSEIGMALSNPLNGERLAGTVGRPLPGVSVQLVDRDQNPVVEGQPGEVEVRGAAVFAAYWQRPRATEEAFRGGWFRTGDVAEIKDGIYRLLGRASVDILKTGGEKVSALEIEAVLREHASIVDCAVVGLADEEWGQRVAAAVELTPDSQLELEDLRAWAKERLAIYKVPTRLSCVGALPRNALGKVQKPKVQELFREPELAPESTGARN